MNAYKVMTHDLRPPIQGGPPVWDGTLPYDLLTVATNESGAECAAGWNACADPVTALRIAGLWPDGRPSRLFRLAATAPVLERGDKLRASTWRIEAEEPVSDEIIARLHAPMAGDGLPLADLVAEVQAWRAALARPCHDLAAVEAGLRTALNVRGLEGWSLRRYDTARAARSAWAAGAALGARAARDTWAARSARSAWSAWAAGAALDARDAGDTWNARDAGDTWNAGDVWDAWNAGDALTVYAAARCGWGQCPPDLLTLGLRDAYTAGLDVAVPVATNVLGWAVEEVSDDR